MNPQSKPTPEQQPVVPMAEIPKVLESGALVPIPVIPLIPVTQTAAQTTPATSLAVPAVGISPIPPNSSNPVLAGDVDVIEKEWVDQAEAIIARTAGDPHAEEEAIEDLQIDYMKKRYGKDVAKSGDQ